MALVPPGDIFTPISDPQVSVAIFIPPESLEVQQSDFYSRLYAVWQSHGNYTVKLIGCGVFAHLIENGGDVRSVCSVCRIAA